MRWLTLMSITTAIAWNGAWREGSAQSKAGRSFAFLVACGDYDPSALKPVPFTLQEMKTFREVLIGSGVPADNIIHLHDKTDQPGRLIPIKSNILREYKQLLARLRPEDSLIVALSGHGIQYRSDKSGYFCPLDARLGPDHKKTLVALDGDDGILPLLDRTKARRKLVIINACRNDPASDAFLAAEKLELRDDYSEEAPRGTVVLFACSKGQRSYFYADTEKRPERRNRSLFMYHLTEAWKGTYAQGKKITADHVVQQVADRVEEDAPRDFRNNQIPLVRRQNVEGSWPLAAPAATPAPPLPGGFASVAYGSHPRQIIDFYQAQSSTPTPVVLYIHGGGWRGGDKKSVGETQTRAYRDAGISVAAFNYRFIQDAAQENLQPPVRAPLEDAARAVQFLRSKAWEWNLDKNRIGATGGSAGGCSALWLALHDDLGDPKSSDPIARESTRLYCAAVQSAQTSLDPKELREWLPNYTYGAHAFGLKTFDEMHDQRESLLKWIRKYSPIEHVTKDDPPIGLFYDGARDARAGAIHPDPTHSPVLGMKLAEKLKAVGVDVEFHSTGMPNARYPSAQTYLIERLRK